MVSIQKKVVILESVANGATLSEAGATVGVSPTRARDLLGRVCRIIKMPPSVKQIRSCPQSYLAKVQALKKESAFALRDQLKKKLMLILRLKNTEELTPQYLSNLTVVQLINSGITFVAVTEIQEWLSKSGLSLKTCLPESDFDIKQVRRAIAILEVYQFDVSVVKGQLNYFLNG